MNHYALAKTAMVEQITASALQDAADAAILCSRTAQREVAAIEPPPDPDC